MIKRIIGLTILLLVGILIGNLRGQTPQEEPENQAIKLPELPAKLQGKDFVRFWRLILEGNKGNWHLYNAEDTRFLSDIQKRIESRQYSGSRIEWFVMEGKLPK